MRLRAFALAFGLLGATTAVAQVVATEPSSDASPELRSCIEQMISIFENETPSLDYDVVDDLNDGRGYTAGRSGFTSKEGDLLEVIEAYGRMRPNNVLSVFITTLKDRKGTASTEGLEGLPAAWKEATADPLFRQAQDQVSDKLYYTPAMREVNALHLRSPLAKLALYDAMIQHGVGEDPDSFGGILRAATLAAQGPPVQAGEEKWLMAFLTARKEILLNSRDPDNRTAWQASVGRVDEQIRLLNEGNLQLSSPLTVNPNGTAFTVNCAPASAPLGQPNETK
jgi:chitosanase